MTTQEVPAPQITTSQQRAGSLAWMARRDRLTVAAMVLVAFCLRVPNLGRAYWIDEGISLGISSHSLAHIPALLRQDGSPPLFYVILHFWTEAFGTSQVATHLLPLACSLLAIPLAYWSASDIFDRRAGLAAAALFATNPLLDWYSTETRMYPLVIVLATLGITLAWRGVRDQSLTSGIGAVASFTALLYTHDWGIYLTAVTAGVMFLMARSRDRVLARWVALGALACAVLWLPWLPTFAYQAGHTAAPWAVSPNIGDFFADPSTAIGGTLAVVVAPLLAFAVYRTRRERSPQRSRTAGVIGAIGMLTALGGFLGAQVNPSWTGRYLAVTLAPLLVAAAGALAPSRRGVGFLVAVCCLLGSWAAIGTLIPNSNARYAKSNVAAVAHDVGPALRPGDLVVVTQSEQVAVLSHYLPPGLVYVTPTGPVADPGVVDWRDIVHRLQVSTPCSAVAPSINALPVGAHLLLVDPARHLGARGSAWSRAVAGQVRADDRLVGQDQSLAEVGSFDPALHPKPFSPVDAILYRKVGIAPACE